MGQDSVLSYEFESLTVNHNGEIIKRTPGKAYYYKERLEAGIYLDMVYIPGGKFMMGSPLNEKGSWYRDIAEYPQHEVTVKPFWIGKYTVTQTQWKTIIKYNPS